MPRTKSTIPRNRKEMVALLEPHLNTSPDPKEDPEASLIHGYAKLWFGSHHQNSDNRKCFYFSREDHRALISFLFSHDGHKVWVSLQHCPGRDRYQNIVFVTTDRPKLPTVALPRAPFVACASHRGVCKELERKTYYLPEDRQKQNFETHLQREVYNVL